MSFCRRRFTKEFKLAPSRRLELGASVAEVDCVGRGRAGAEREAELVRKVGCQALEIDFCGMPGSAA